ncbi:hypothetical protein LOCC1_G005539 [Lachnellula occidentalis]|uniref:Mei5 protein n=1 Tax=Lachnellula occidentalis TaxID=215460 RepID=A0A8H8RSM5_9HELO|nr:hypothetical protein LOCC1_G005539 [Lachnellula occidentalis]
MAVDLTHAFEMLLTNIRNLTSDDSFKTIVGVFDETPRLKGLIESKDNELRDLKGEISELKTRHENRLQENLELYRTQQNKLEEEKAALARTISTAEATIQAKDAASAEHTRTQDSIQAELSQVAKLLDAEKKKLAAANTDITKLQQSIKGRDIGLDKLKECLKAEKALNSKTKSVEKVLKTEITTLQGNLQLSATKLDEIEGFTTELKEVDEAVWIEKLEEVWEAARSAVSSLFKEDLVEKTLRDRSAWKNLRESRPSDRVIPLPRSNSLEAKQMRIAALLAILARSISQHIFQPTYLLENDDERDEMRELLVLQAVADSKKESFCRALLLSIFPMDQEKNGMKAMERVVREVSWCVRNLISDAKYDGFQSKMENIACKAWEAWRIIQSTREKFEPLFELDHVAGLEWRALPFDERRVSVSQDSIARVEADEAFGQPPDPVTPGVVLMKSQSTLAAKELETVNISSLTTGRAGPRSQEIRARTMSISANGISANGISTNGVSVNGTNGFLSQPTLSGETNLPGGH